MVTIMMTTAAMAAPATRAAKARGSSSGGSGISCVKTKKSAFFAILSLGRHHAVPPS
jgi:hypothetical protein